ncbi:MAG TPA: TetR family transcriptional regulator, partial [Thermodesulfobacteriota bacterium]|nr:TetR family transcriptional regulator [Thermodesulfobacteriota bacterium]
LENIYSRTKELRRYYRYRIARNSLVTRLDFSENKSLKAREKILAAADRVFGEMGFDAATVRRIAALSKTNKALIHYHFGSKEGLFESVLDHYFEDLSQTLHGTLISSRPLPERIRLMFDGYVGFLEKNKNFVHIVQREINGGRQMTRVLSHMVPLFQLVLRAMQEAYPKARSGSLSAEQLLISGYGMIITYFTCSGIVEKLIGGSPMSPKNLENRRRHLNRMVEVIIRALDS